MPAAAADYGDLIYFQGHSAPGIYARAFLEGRISEKQLENFRSEIGGGGLSSYPHPWLMPDFWQFPTVSMGLGPIQSIYQARFMRYLENRDLIPPTNRKVWAFVGDGEMDEPESLGAISLATREGLDNLIFVVNCNLQRLDGPVRGNGKIIQELEAVFRGAGWNVIKVIWGSYWDALLAQDKDGLLQKRMEEALDGDYQTYRANSGGYIREHFFGKYPELKDMVARMTDDDIWRLNRGGHDPHKVYAAFHSAFHHTGQPTVILAKTIKGYGMGDAGEARNISHQQKKISDDALRRVRDRFRLPIADADIGEVPFFRPPDDAPEMKYMRERLAAMGGVPARKQKSPSSLPAPPLSAFSALLEDTGERKISTTMAFVRILSALVRDKNIGKNIVPIVPDESRTFGMEGMFRQLGIYARQGQLYQPEDADQMMFYREDKKGQILQEGINEAGRDVVVDGGGDFLQPLRRANPPVLHFLFHVRLSADRRPGVGGGRHAGARLFAGCDIGADDSQRRGAAARGRPQPDSGAVDSQLPLLRPGLCLRVGGDYSGRRSRDAGGAARCFLLHHSDERKLRAHQTARRRRRKIFCAGCILSAKAG